MTRNELNVPMCAVSVDCLIFTIDEQNKKLKILLLNRDHEPEQGKWALPGSFISSHDTLEEVVLSIVNNVMDSSIHYMEQLYTFGDNLTRDPRMRVVSTAYLSLYPQYDAKIKENKNLSWFTVSKCTEDTLVLTNDIETIIYENGYVKSQASIGFDHNEMIIRGVERLRSKITYSPLGFYFLGNKFTLNQIQMVHETILDRKLHKSNFRKSISRYVDGLNETIRIGNIRSAQVFMLKKEYKGD